MVVELLTNVWNSIDDRVLRLLVGILIFMIGFVLGKLAQRFSYKGLKELEANRFLRKTTSMRINIESIISHALAYVIYFFAIVAALDHVGVANIVLYMLAGAVIVILIISFFLSMRDFIPNFTAGFYIYNKLKLKEGMDVQINDIRGEITDIELLQVKLRTKKKEIMCIPNQVVANAQITIKKESTVTKIKKKIKGTRA